MCIGAVHYHLQLLSNVLKESIDNLSPICSSPSMTCALLSLSCGLDLYLNSLKSMLCCSNLHEELERMCSCQLFASASSRKEGSVVSLLILKL